MELDALASLVRRVMGDFPAPWGVAGGWAVDLFLGRATRPHADVEVALFRQDQLLLQAHFSTWQIDRIVDGRREAWGAGEYLQLPAHELHGRSCGEPGEAMEFLLNERDATRWIFRRNPVIVLPFVEAIISSRLGVPILAPQIVALYKSHSDRPKDQADVLAVRQSLNPTQRDWLQQAVRICYPESRWASE